MTTLIQQGKGITRYVRTCDAKCHTAKGIKCECICEGALHGKGSAEAALTIQKISRVNPNFWPGAILNTTAQREIEFPEKDEV